MSSARSRSPFLKPGLLVLALGWYSGVVLGGTGLTDGMGVLNINVLVVVRWQEGPEHFFNSP